jgi:predicted NBD/HSP70 family sugar kinase
MSILSIDIGGTSIKYALMGKDEVILSRGKIPTPQEGRSKFQNDANLYGALQCYLENA